MMKKSILGILGAALFFSCSDNKSNTNSGDSGPSTTNVQNVNGNQPDTTNGITLDNRQTTDSTRRDTVHH